MQIIGERGLSGLVKLMLDCVFTGGMAIFITLPWCLNLAFDLIMNTLDENYYFLLGFLYFTGFFALFSVYEMKKIFKNLNKRNPFIMDNVISLKRMSIACFIISVAYIVKIIFYPSILTVILAMVFIIAGLFLIILSEVFRQAVIVKQENDLTI
ncbi:MAG TPA: DUF2975 domain-containing protein [Acetivibrio sp.]|jgi:hypothetical protein|nr:DUF2975 domain-containing protein [Clostridium sp.]HOQ01662.1 DUF2975 domain-containing protein [Acetivibrio clariflavus]HQA58014.1 DUF2975 domain-containing protein [Acetivibrio sp.]